MYTSDITIGTENYALRTQRASSSVRAEISQPVSEPRLLTISHENVKSGRVSSAVMLDDSKVVQIGASAPTLDTMRVMVKIQYNPLSGRTDIDAEIKAMITTLTTFLGVAGNVTKLLNQES